MGFGTFVPFSCLTKKRKPFRLPLSIFFFQKIKDLIYYLSKNALIRSATFCFRLL